MAPSARANGLQGACSQDMPPHIGHRGSSRQTATPYPHSAQWNSPLTLSPADQNCTYSVPAPSFAASASSVMRPPEHNPHSGQFQSSFSPDISILRPVQTPDPLP